jgi:hypothetical protein
MHPTILPLIRRVPSLPYFLTWLRQWLNEPLNLPNQLNNMRKVDAIHIEPQSSINTPDSQLGSENAQPQNASCSS